MSPVTISLSISILVYSSAAHYELSQWLQVNGPAHRCDFYSASALIEMQTAVIATAILSVCPSVRHVPVFCPD